MTAAGASVPRRGSSPQLRAGAPKAASARPSLLALAQAAAVLLIAGGWLLREDRWLVPREGLGYALGIAGLGMMTALLIYPARKRVGPARGRIGAWLQLHMVLGLAGPVAILFHANFQLGSQNANIALFCTLVVAASGVVGRVFYVRIHEGLTGRRRTLGELRGVLDDARSALALAADDAHAVREMLLDLERRSLGDGSLARPGVGSLLVLPWRSRQTRRRALAALGRRRRRASHAGRRLVRGYVGAIRSVALFSLYERVFSLWHVAHLPLCFLLYATAAVHVVAVHMY